MYEHNIQKRSIFPFWNSAFYGHTALLPLHFLMHFFNPKLRVDLSRSPTSMFSIFCTSTSGFGLKNYINNCSGIFPKHAVCECETTLQPSSHFVGLKNPLNVYTFLKHYIFSATFICHAFLCFFFTK